MTEDSKKTDNGFGTSTEWMAAALIFLIGAPVAYWFLGSSDPPKPTVPYEAIKTCQEKVKSDATHPSTVVFSSSGQATDVTKEGIYRVRLGFTAQNSFGAELKMDSLCVFEPGSATRIARYGAWEKS